MTDREKVLKGLECLITNETPCEGCPYNGSGYCLKNIAEDARELLKEQEPNELTKEEWEKWKKDKRRDPICAIFYGDTTPFWVLRPEEINEILYFMKKIKLFTKKPTKEQVKWDDT